MKSKLIINVFGTKEWILPNGSVHREDGPAVEHTNGTKYWYIDNELHREDGPACEYSGGGKWWYLNGQLHRENGPAIEYRYGDKEWYINGIEYSEKEYKYKTRSIKLKKLLK